MKVGSMLKQIAIDKLYKIEKIIETGALYILIVSGRKRGKSSAAKKYVFNQSFLYGRKFALIFRTRDGKSQEALSRFFSEPWFTSHIKKISKGKYEGVHVKTNICYLYYYDNKGKRIDDLEIGAVCFLDEEEKNKSMVFNDYYNIYMEEFISRYGYLHNEVVILESLISTILRFNMYDENAHVILIGNTVSRVCPYSSEWGLNFINQKEETIEIKEIERNIEGIDFKFKIATERLKNADEGISISTKGKQMETGEWETGKIPLFKDNKNDFETVYEFVYFYYGFCFLLSCLSKDDNLFIVCEKKTTPIKKGTRVISDLDSYDPLYTKDFIPLRNSERIIFNLIKQNKIFFCDALTGADFYNCLQSQKREINYL